MVRIQNILTVVGLSRFDRMHFENTQADYEGDIANLSFTMTSANFITKAKQAFAQAFQPAFASALA